MSVVRWSFFIMIVILITFGCSQPKRQTLTIAAAANVQYAMDSLVSAFEQETSVDCEVVVSSSGKLTAQISKGAPYDVFLSADMRYPKALFDQGFVKNEPIVYAQGSLILWSADDDISLDLWKRLVAPTTKNIAVANPKTAPYGIATLQVLQVMQYLDSLETKLIYGESIAQTNHFITSGAADMGFTAKSVVMTSQMNKKGSWVDLDPKLYDPIDQGMAIVDHDGYEVPSAQQFYDFMLSPKAQSILVHFGYLTPD